MLRVQTSTSSIEVPTTFTLTYEARDNVQPPDLHGIDHFFRVTADRTIQQPLRLYLSYQDDGPVKSETLTLYRLANSAWVTDDIQVEEQSPGYLEATIQGMGSYGLLGQVERIYLPLVTRR